MYQLTQPHRATPGFFICLQIASQTTNSGYLLFYNKLFKRSPKSQNLFIFLKQKELP